MKKDTKYFPTPYSYSQAVAAGDYVFLGRHRGFGNNFTEQFHIDGVVYRGRK